MNHIYLAFLTLLTSLCLSLPARSAVAHSDAMYMGSVAMDVPAGMVLRLTPLTHYLTKKTGIKITFRASPNLGSAVNELGKDFTQIAYLTPKAFVEAHDKYRARALVAPLTHGKNTFNLFIVVRQNSPIQTMADLKGKSFAFGDETALLQRAVVVGGGVKLEEFSKYSFLKHYDNIAKAVLNKDFDGGILKDTSYEEFGAQGLRKIHTSPPLASYLFAVNEHVPAETIKKLRTAFLELKADTPEGKAILTELDAAYNGFVPAEDKDYDAIRKLIAPFQIPAPK